MRKKIVAGNWKMNKTFQEGIDLASMVNEMASELNTDVNIIMAPPFYLLDRLVQITANSKVEISAQNCATEERGAYTGEISAEMIASTGSKYVILGHSERRSYYHEDDETIKVKVDIAINNKLNPIFCCGEVLEEREGEKHYEVVKRQLEKSLFHLSPERMEKVVVAYEPVWAIGTGKTASPEQAQEMHAYIRKLISEKYGEELAEKISILYGGSCKPSNARDIFSKEDVDGGLIGGASLKAQDFIEIVKAF